MTYYSKYLKYKNKYLELKNMIGGDFTGLERDLDGLWEKRVSERKVFDVTYFTQYSQYCWISGPSYGLGFFLYKLKLNQEPVTGHNRVGKYAVWNMTLNNIGPRYKVTSTSIKDSSELSYKTTIDLLTANGNKLNKGTTSFDWSNNDDGWVYKNDKGELYKSGLIDVDALWKARNDAGKVFEVTYCVFKPFYSQYCWISGTSYGVGFFLYRFNNTSNTNLSVMNGHVQNGNYALWHLNESDITMPLGVCDKVCDKVCENLLYKTTIKLPTTDLSLGELPLNTPFDWSHVQNSWIYQNGQKFFKTGLKLK